MTTASEIIHISRNANDAVERAQQLTDNLEQDWESEATLYTFADNSVLVVSGSQVSAYEDIDAAKSDLLA